MDITLLVVTTIFGLGVLSAYFVVFGHWVRKNYFTHPFWMGIPGSVVQTLSVFQVLAVVGFLAAMSTWIHSPPKGGVMNGYAVVLTVVVFMIGAIIWPFATYFDYPWASVSSLLVSAVASILLLAGSIEEDNPRWWVVAGLTMFSTVTVLGDGVVWNANYILKQKQKKSSEEKKLWEIVSPNRSVANAGCR